MVESTVGALEANIDCECDERNIQTVQLEEITQNHEECLKYFQFK